MLTKTQASAIADAFVESGKAQRNARLEASATRIPRIYQSRFLSQVPAWRQAQLIHEARRPAGFTWLTVGYLVCMVLFSAILLFSFFSGHTRSLAMSLLIVPIMGMGTLFRVMLVKIRLQELLLEERAMTTNHTL